MRKRKARGTRVRFKAGRKTVTFWACTTSGRGKSCRKRPRRRTSAAARAAGRRLAKKYGFVSKHGKLYRKSPRRGLIRVRH